MAISVKEAYESLCSEKSDEVYDQTLLRVTEPSNHLRFGIYAGFALGFQIALEVSQISPEVARETITHIHSFIDASEQNQNALEYVALVKD